MKTQKQNLAKLTILILVAVSLINCSSKPENIILMIGDGMGPQQVSIAAIYAKEAPGSVVKDRTLAFEKIMDEGVTGYMLTYPKDSLVVDSASSATQLALADYSRSEMIGVNHEGLVKKTILELAKQKGMMTGLVSDTRLTHATPASFAAHVPHRSFENKIAQQMIETSADVMLSGGLRHFIPQNSTRDTLDEKYSKKIPISTSIKSKRNDDMNLLQTAEKKGYDLVFTKQQLEKTEKQKILGLFANSGMPDAIKTRLEKSDPGRVYPTLKEMVMKTLDVMAQADDGFFLMIEGGQIDWAGHNNDAGMLLHQMLEFDETLEYVREWVKKDGNTLLVITADHETGGVGFSYSRYHIPQAVDWFSDEFKDSKFSPWFNFGSLDTLDKLYNQKKALVRIMFEFDSLPPAQQSPAKLRDMVNGNLEFKITLDDATNILATEPNIYYQKNHKYLDTKDFPRVNEFEAYYVYGRETRTALIARALANQQQIVWATGTHTSTPVFVVALGPQAEMFSGMHHSSEVGMLMRKALGLH